MAPPKLKTFTSVLDVDETVAEHGLARAVAEQNWHEWWRIYAEMHNLPWPPTGRDVAMAKSQKLNRSAS